jgi:hypothetical protein
MAAHPVGRGFSNLQGRRIKDGVAMRLNARSALSIRISEKAASA